MRSWMLGVIAVLILLAGAGAGYAVARTQPGRGRPQPTHSPSVLDVATAEACLGAAVNSDRAAVGLPGLPVDGALSAYARSHSDAMEAAGTIWHTGGSPANPEPTGEQFHQALPQPWRPDPAAAENVGSDPAGDCASMNAAYVASPPHLANIRGTAWTIMGIGVAFAPDGTMFSTEDFVEVPTVAIPSPATAPSPHPLPPSPRPLATSCAP